jgi:non-heme chloroperoxidase
MPRRRRLLLASAVLATAAGTAALVRADARWSAADDPCRPEERLLPPGERRTVRTDDGADLAVTVAGPAGGPAVVLAHCWTGAREVWAPVAHRLARSGHRVVLYDQRGHGSSTVGDDGFTIPRLGHDLRAVLTQLDVRDAVLAGHSMGGMTIQSLAVEDLGVIDDRVRGIVLVATAASGMSRGSRGDATLGWVATSRGVERFLRSPLGHAMVRGVVGRAVSRNHLVLTRDLWCACAPEVRHGWMTAMAAMDLRRGIARIGVPVTIVAGARDILTPPSRAAELAALIPGAQLRTLPERGHMLPLEAPDEVATEISALTASRASTAA